MENPGDESRPPFGTELRRRWAHFRTFFDLRARFWDLLNFLEENRAVRVKIYVTLTTLVVLGSALAWFYPGWREENALQMARQWLAADKLDRAGEAVQVALATAPGRVESWQLAAEYARRAGLKLRAQAYARHAAVLDGASVARALDWAAAALAAEDLDDATAALAQAARLGGAGSAFAERLAGELARQRGDLAAARTHFEAALRLDGPLAIDEVPLGVVLADATGEADRQRGLALLAKWAADPVWGAEALRALLAQAMIRGDHAMLLKWAEALRVHPARVPSDTLNSLLALAKADDARFATALAEEEKNAADPGAIVDLVSWLSGTGRGAEALRWVRTLPAGVTGGPPVVVAVADALRVSADWENLRTWTQTGDWQKLDFLRQAYAALAARQLGESDRAAELWAGLRAAAHINGGQAFFLAGVIYTWGWRDEAAELWLIAAEQPGVALNALGALARHYQLQHDAEGLYHAFRALYEVRAQDPGIANNFAYLAVLTGHDELRAEQTARANYTRFPDNLNYRSTYAFALHREGRTAEALALLEPVAAEAAHTPSLAFTYGLVLAASGRAAEARMALANVNRSGLTTRELELLNAALSSGSAAGEAR